MMDTLWTTRDGRLINTTNRYHLWAYLDPSFRLPIGMRDVDQLRSTGARGLCQRPISGSAR